MNFLLVVLLLIELACLVLSKTLKEESNDTNTDIGSNSVRTKCVLFSKKTVCQKQGIKYVINQNHEMPFNKIEKFIKLAHLKGKEYNGKNIIFECSDEKSQDIFKCEDKTSGSVFYINVPEDSDKRVKRSLRDSDNQMEPINRNRLRNRHFRRIRPRFLKFADAKKYNAMQRDCRHKSKCTTPKPCRTKRPTICTTTTKCPETIKTTKRAIQLPTTECKTDNVKQVTSNCNKKIKREDILSKMISQDNILERLISLA